MKIITFIILTKLCLFSFPSTELEDTMFICPTSDCHYLYRLNHPIYVPIGALGYDVFQINEDKEVLALVSGRISVEKKKSTIDSTFSFKVILKSDKYKISYFTIDSIYVSEDDVVEQGTKIGQFTKSKNLLVQVLEDDTFFDPKYKCELSGVKSD